jgi:hypothetical protein
VPLLPPPPPLLLSLLPDTLSRDVSTVCATLLTSGCTAMRSAERAELEAVGRGAEGSA